jgi:DNA-directed RNA polymerase alpha subunit
MNIEIIYSDDYDCSFKLKKSSGPIANAIRRTMMSHIPILAIDSIENIENTSILTNDQIILRLIYIPIVSENVDKFNHHLECDCDKECEKCSIRFSINISNPSDSKVVKTVYSSDIQIDDTNMNGVKVYHSSDKYFIPITRLAPGQKLVVSGYIKKGIGKDHSKWSPVCTSTYTFVPRVEIKNKSELSSEDVKKLVGVCPTKVFKSKTGDIEDLMIDNSKCVVCNECVYTFPKNVSVDFQQDEIIFSVETTGSLKANTVIQNAIEILKTL